ncbi:MAG: stalk domain-containing protein [Paenibacillaceae bacterium]
MIIIRRIGFVLFFVLTVMFLTPVLSLAEVAAEKPIPVYYNDEAIQFHIDPISMQGTTLVEFRPIFEKLGFQITWNQATKTVRGYKEGLSVELQVGSLIAKVNGVEQQLQLAPMVVNGSTIVPLRFVGEAAGSYVQWDSVDRIIHLYRISPNKSTTLSNYSTIQGRTPADVQWVRFDITKEGSEDIVTVYTQPEAGLVDTEIYLSDGAGVYQIEVFHSKLGHKETGFYTYNTSFSLVNYANSGLHLDSTVTDNSRLRLYGELLEEDRTILLIIQNEATEEIKQIFFAPVDQVVEKDIYLSMGEGSYTLGIYKTEEPVTNRLFEKLYLMKSYSLINNDTRDPDLLPSEMVESEHPEIVTLAQQITQGVDTDLKKSRKIHDWVAGNIDYDAATFVSGGDRMDTALETLRGRLTDCDGYARLNIALHRAAGIKARMIIGSVIDIQSGQSWSQVDLDNPNHAWNEVFVDGRWITQDPTWDAGYIGSNDQFVRDLSDDYYDPTPEAFARDHSVYLDLGYKYE